MCMKHGEVIRRIEAGETASMIAKRQWNRMLNVVNRWNIESGNQLMALMEAYEVSTWCALCEKYDDCHKCPLHKADNGKSCLDDGSVYMEMWNTENNESLVTSIKMILEMLDKANVIELGDGI
jgi:hypothetical protein